MHHLHIFSGKCKKILPVRLGHERLGVPYPGDRSDNTAIAHIGVIILRYNRIEFIDRVVSDNTIPNHLKTVTQGIVDVLDMVTRGIGPGGELAEIVVFVCPGTGRTW